MMYANTLSGERITARPQSEAICVEIEWPRPRSWLFFASRETFFDFHQTEGVMIRKIILTRKGRGIGQLFTRKMFFDEVTTKPKWKASKNFNLNQLELF